MRRQHRLDSRPVRCAYASQPTSRPHCQLSAVVRYGPIALCADCDARRSTLGKGITPHRLPPQPPLDVLDWIASADAAVHQAHTELAAAVARARATAAASSVWAWCTAASAEAIQSRTSSGGWGGNRWGVMPLPRVERRASQSAHSAIGP